MPYFPEAPPAAPVVPADDFAAYRERYRAGVPALRKFAYFNHASVGPLHDDVVAAANEHLAQQQMGETVAQEAWFDGWRLSRQRVAELLGDPDRGNVCLHSSTYTGLLRAFNALPLGPGDEALVPADEFPSVWHALTEVRGRGASIRSVDSSRGEGIVRTADLLDAITPATRLIAVSWVNFFHGYRHDIAALGAACHERGIWLAVDVIQGLGQLQLDAAACGAHFIAGQGAKWLCAPLGSGFLWVSPDVPPEITPRSEGWFAMELNHASYTDRSVRPKTNANRFATGTVPMACAYGLRRACELLLEAGSARAEQAALAAADRIDDAARELGIPVRSDRRNADGSFGDHRSAIIGLDISNCPGFPQALQDAGAVFSVREGMLRLSPHWYTAECELNLVIDTMRSCAAIQLTTA